MKYCHKLSVQTISTKMWRIILLNLWLSKIESVSFWKSVSFYWVYHFTEFIQELKNRKYIMLKIYLNSLKIMYFWSYYLQTEQNRPSSSLVTRMGASKWTENSTICWFLLKKTKQFVCFCWRKQQFELWWPMGASFWLTNRVRLLLLLSCGPNGC